MSETKDEQAGGALAPGTPAPDFKLHSTPDQFVSLSDFRGAPVILAFYPADWSPVCGDQMALYNEILPEFRRFKAQLLGVSVDGMWCHAAFAKDRNLHFPLLADFEAKGAVAPYLRCLSAAGRHLRARAVRDRFQRRDYLELYLSTRSKPWCRWDLVGARGPHARAGEEKMRTHFAPRLVLSVSERDHIRGQQAHR